MPPLNLQYYNFFSQMKDGCTFLFKYLIMGTCSYWGPIARTLLKEPPLTLQYKNIFSLLEELYPGGRSSPDWPLTNWTTSGFWSPAGLVTSAPVFSSLTQLPTLVGQFVRTFPLYW
jgi:hypothetical protein